jgi:hypothetical protein
MASKASEEVRLGFWLAAGFWAFALVMLIILMIAGRALTK